jgi:protein TonB
VTLGQAIAPQSSGFLPQGGIVSLKKAWVIVAALAILSGIMPSRIGAQEPANEIVRRAKSKVQPIYPDLARKMNITGTVRVQVVVSPNGVVKDAKIVGGHPLLANTALEAARKWRFEPAAMESTGVVEFKFEHHQ